MLKPGLMRFALAGLLVTGASSLPAQSLDSVRAEIKRLGTSGEFSGVVLVRKGGKTILHEAYGLASIEYNAPNRIDTRFNLASVGKMFTAVAIAQLVEQGKLKWTDTLSKVLPDYPNKAQASRITIHQLLTHTSGLGLYWDNLFKGNWTAVRTVSELVPFFATQPPVRAGQGLVLQQHRLRRALARRREGVGRGLFRLPAKTHLRPGGHEGN